MVRKRYAANRSTNMRFLLLLAAAGIMWAQPSTCFTPCIIPPNENHVTGGELRVQAPNDVDFASWKSTATTLTFSLNGGATKAEFNTNGLKLSGFSGGGAAQAVCSDNAGQLFVTSCPGGFWIRSGTDLKPLNVNDRIYPNGSNDGGEASATFANWWFTSVNVSAKVSWFGPGPVFPEEFKMALTGGGANLTVADGLSLSAFSFGSTAAPTNISLMHLRPDLNHTRNLGDATHAWAEVHGFEYFADGLAGGGNQVACADNTGLLLCWGNMHGSGWRWLLDPGGSGRETRYVG